MGTEKRKNDTSRVFEYFEMLKALKDFKKGDYFA